MGKPTNNQHVFEINTNPAGAAVWARLAAGLLSANFNPNEDNESKAYLDGNGVKTTIVTGAQPSWSFAGERETGDAAQDYVAGLATSYGDARVTDARVTFEDGSQLTGKVTVSNIQLPGGDANSRSGFGCDISFNGKPSLAPAGAATALTSTVAAGGTAGYTKFTATPTAPNRLVYNLAGTLTTPKGGSYLKSFTEYTSGGLIAATAGQVLHMYEVDPYNHVQKFASKSLVAGDIT